MILSVCTLHSKFSHFLFLFVQHNFIFVVAVCERSFVVLFYLKSDTVLTCSIHFIKFFPFFFDFICCSLSIWGKNVAFFFVSEFSCFRIMLVLGNQVFIFFGFNFSLMCATIFLIFRFFSICLFCQLKDYLK